MAFFIPWLKLSALWTIFKGVLIIRVNRTNFDVVTRQIVKVHRDRIFTAVLGTKESEIVSCYSPSFFTSKENFISCFKVTIEPLGWVGIYHSKLG